MLRQVRFKNFRCLRDVLIDFEPLTVLVGPNASGKTSLLAGLEHSLKSLSSLSTRDSWQHETRNTIEAELTLDSGNTLRIVRNLSHRISTEEWVSGRATPLPSSQTLHLDVSALRSLPAVTQAQRLDSTGANLNNVFESLPRKDQQEVAERFCGLVPMFSDVNSLAHGSGVKRLWFTDRWRESVRYTSDEVSDGTMLVLAYLMVAYQPDKADLLLIEEPERGLHPYLLGEVINVLRTLSSGELGRTVQVVLATHSAELLNCVEPKEVRFLTRKADSGEVQVEKPPVDESKWKDYFHEYQGSLGGVWLSGGLGGVPGR